MSSSDGPIEHPIPGNGPGGEMSEDAQTRRELLDSLAARYALGHRPQGLSGTEYVAWESTVAAADSDARRREVDPEVRDERWYEVAALFWPIRLAQQREFTEDLNR